MVKKSLNVVRLVKRVSGDKSEFERSFPARFRSVRLVKLVNGDKFEIVVLTSFRDVKLVKLDRGEKSEMSLPERFSHVSLVKLERGDTSEIALLSRRNRISPSELHALIFPPRFSDVRLAANSSPVKSLMLLLLASRRVKVAISAGVIDAPLALPSAVSIAARRFASGIATNPVPPLTDTRTASEQLLSISGSPSTCSTHAP